MFNFKSIASLLAVTFAILFTSSVSLEAGHYERHHCRRSHVNVHVNPTVCGSRYLVRSPAYVPVYGAPQPVIAYPAPQPVIAYPVYQPVYVAPQPTLGLSFSWFFR
ncbi:MAG: hypothetical protein BGO14_04210 [Chlamydiales bacterium 38-26]|nr:hypothetical protein [Chlamydiales bacterium]OJV07701.1 MAG: hypothetical protein BGO14_04210 [Chlamydiales bacterium 38-26]